MSNWLKNLKQGDRVYINRGATYSASIIVATVDRATKTFVVVNGEKYRRSDGVKQSDRIPFMPQLLEATPEQDAKRMAYLLKKELKEAVENINSLTIDQIERMLAIANESNTEL